MDRKKLPEIPVEIPHPIVQPDIQPVVDPEEPLLIPPEQIPDLILPEEDSFESLPYEFPVPGEGP